MIREHGGSSSTATSHGCWQFVIEQYHRDDIYQLLTKQDFKARRLDKNRGAEIMTVYIEYRKILSHEEQETQSVESLNCKKSIDALASTNTKSIMRTRYT